MDTLRHSDRLTAPIRFADQPESSASTREQFDWQQLTALGISSNEIKQLAVKIEFKKTAARYYRKLLALGVPIEDAQRIAKAIARFDLTRTALKPHYKNLVSHYCPLVCRAGLWRPNLLTYAESGLDS